MNIVQNIYLNFCFNTVKKSFNNQNCQNIKKGIQKKKIPLKVKLCFYNFLTQQYQNLNVCVPLPNNAILIKGNRDRVFKFQCCQA